MGEDWQEEEKKVADRSRQERGRGNRAKGRENGWEWDLARVGMGSNKEWDLEKWDGLVSVLHCNLNIVDSACDAPANFFD